MGRGSRELSGVLSLYNCFNTPPCWPPGIESELSTAGLRGFRTTRCGGPPQHRRLASSASGVPRAAAAGRPHRSSLKQIKRRRGPSRRDFTAGAHHGGRRTRPVGSVAGLTAAQCHLRAECTHGVLTWHSHSTRAFAIQGCRLCCNGVLTTPLRCRRRAGPTGEGGVGTPRVLRSGEGRRPTGKAEISRILLGLRAHGHGELLEELVHAREPAGKQRRIPLRPRQALSYSGGVFGISIIRIHIINSYL